jgi:hypothetical protein
LEVSSFFRMSRSWFCWLSTLLRTIMGLSNFCVRQFKKFHFITVYVSLFLYRSLMITCAWQCLRILFLRFFK